MTLHWGGNRSFFFPQATTSSQTLEGLFVLIGCPHQPHLTLHSAREHANVLLMTQEFRNGAHDITLERVYSFLQ